MQRHPISVLSVALGLVLLFTEGVKKIRYAEGLLEEISNAGIVKPSNVGHLPLHLWYANTLFFLATLLVFVTALYIGAQLKLKSIRENKLKHVDLAAKTLDGMMAASLRIRNQLITQSTQPSLQFCRIEITYVIRKSYDVDVVKLYHIRAAGSAVHFWEFPIRVDGLACEVGFLDSLNFKVKDESGSDVVYLPMKNEARSKAVVLYFLPEIKTNEAKARIIRLAYNWPGLANSLKSKKRDNWSWNLESHDLIPNVKIKFLCEDLEGKVEAAIVGDQRGRQLLKDLGKNEACFYTWEYTVEDAPSGKYMIELRLK